MRSTLDLPDPLYRRLKLKAAQEGRTLREIVIRYLERGLAEEATPFAALPVLPRAGRRIRPMPQAELWQLLEGEEIGPSRS